MDKCREEFESNGGKWLWEIHKEQQITLIGLKDAVQSLAQTYKHDAHDLSLIGEQDKARIYNRIANQLDHLLKGGA